MPSPQWLKPYYFGSVMYGLKAVPFTNFGRRSNDFYTAYANGDAHGSDGDEASDQQSMGSE
jgi:hypothetical protein